MGLTLAYRSSDLELFYMQPATLTIFVKTVGTLKSLEEGPKVVSLEIPEGFSVSQAIERMGLKDWEVGLILINGTHGTKESILKDQDQVTLIAPLVGG
jgi:putative ubiquitin-RnfH superfamily antitoxin RatB of RatAB toxin-antitoxin module